MPSVQITNTVIIFSILCRDTYLYFMNILRQLETGMVDDNTIEIAIFNVKLELQTELYSFKTNKVQEHLYIFLKTNFVSFLSFFDLIYILN